MTPQEQERLQACVTEIAQILYNNTPAEQIATLEGIEKTVRQQLMEYVTSTSTHKGVVFTRGETSDRSSEY